MPVCARDTGIYVGFACCLLVLAFLGRGRRPSEPPRLPVALLGVAFIGVMAWDGLTSNLGLRQTTNDLRLASGILAGYGIALFLAPILNGEIWRASSRDKVLGATGEVWVWLASVPLTYVTVRYLLPLSGVGYPLLVAAAILGTFISVNLAIVSLIPRFQRRAQGARDLVAPVLLSAGVTAVEFAISAALKAWLLSLAG